MTEGKAKGSGKLANSEQKKLSTSALAKQLEVPVNQLFSNLQSHGWIKKLEEGWGLTAKGEYEGGEYLHSKRYGRYIVWPPSIVEHRLLKQLDEDRMLSASGLGKSYHLSAAEVNRALAELGWQRRGFHGWTLTPQGQMLSGVQMENKQSGMKYVLWPESVAEQVALQRLLQQCQAVSQSNDLTVGLGQNSGDLFSTKQESYPSIDGRHHRNQGLQRICHWLYLAGIVHACDRQLPCEEPLYADFYLPLNNIYIEYWHSEEQPKALNNRLARENYYKKTKQGVIDIHPEDLDQLDEILPRQLDKYGVNYR